MATNKNTNSIFDLTPEEIKKVEEESKKLFTNSYMNDYSKMYLNNDKGFGKINAFVDGNRLNPKLISNRNIPNSVYLKKNQAILSKSKTGITTYQYDYCGLKPKKKIRTKSIH